MMATSLSDQNCAQATISVQIPGGAYITRKLKNGETVAVGSDATADLRLENADVSGMHCLLSVENGMVNIKDCYSAAGTFVDNRKIQDVRATSDCTVRVGHHEIQLKLLRPFLPAATAVQASMPLPPSTQRLTTPADSHHPVGESESVLEDDDDDVAEALENPKSRITNLLLQLEQAETEIEILKERLESRPVSNVVPAEDPFQQEMIDLLREEIVSLQQELDRQQRNESLRMAVGSDQPSSHDLPTREEVETVLDRLESLLDELHQKDEQILGLQDLLLAAENANQAEQDEREQLAKWLGDFEMRLDAASDEWKLENEQLKSKLLKSEQDLDEVRSALVADSVSAKSEALERVAKSMREQIAQQQIEIDALVETNKELREQVLTSQGASTREEEIRLARERAEVARMRHDLEVRISKISGGQSEGDHNFTSVEASEQKLREIREQMRATSRNERTPPSLGSRFLNLLGRLNS